MLLGYHGRADKEMKKEDPSTISRQTINLRMTMKLLNSLNSHHLDDKKRYQFNGEIKWNLKQINKAVETEEN